MINYHHEILDNGLQLIIHEDDYTPLVVVNLLYQVGSKDENPNRTGFAHLFEHLMFGGSLNLPDYDDIVQNAGGDSNAFTSNDITNFYASAPANNLDVLLWAEADRMQNLLLNPKSLANQKKVVIEEFKETCLNQPYGDVWHHLSSLVYKEHPYRWPVIGKDFSHIKDATLDEVSQFHEKFYTPNNAILVIAGKVNKELAIARAKHWFSGIKSGPILEKQYPSEPEQTEKRLLAVASNVPSKALFMVFKTMGRLDKSYYTLDLLSDYIAGSKASLLYQNLLKRDKLFIEIDCYLNDTSDAPGLLIVEGKLSDGIEFQQAEQAIWNELDALITTPLESEFLQRQKNRIESQLAFSESGVLNKAMNLAYFQSIGNIELINSEGQKYQDITVDDVLATAVSVLKPSNCSVMYYG
jgi:predicted Zn-dependent peptidase